MNYGLKQTVTTPSFAIHDFFLLKVCLISKLIKDIKIKSEASAGGPVQTRALWYLLRCLKKNQIPLPHHRKCLISICFCFSGAGLPAQL